MILGVIGLGVVGSAYKKGLQKLRTELLWRSSYFRDLELILILL
jgi:phosphoglycerate dehydrogenase-like enzyme